VTETDGSQALVALAAFPFLALSISLSSLAITLRGGPSPPRVAVDHAVAAAMLAFFGAAFLLHEYPFTSLVRADAVVGVEDDVVEEFQGADCVLGRGTRFADGVNFQLAELAEEQVERLPEERGRVGGVRR